MFQKSIKLINANCGGEIGDVIVSGIDKVIGSTILEQSKYLFENKKLRKEGLSWKKIESFGLEYRESAQYLQGKISKKEMIEKATKATENFARRQMVWFKKDQRIYWVKNYKEATNLILLSFKDIS